METSNDKLPTESVSNVPEQHVPRQQPVHFKAILLPAAFLGLIFLGLIITMLVRLMMINATSHIQTLSPTPTSSPSETGVSQIGKTPEFIDLLKNVEQLKTGIETVDLSESKLTFPLIDWEVNYQK